jgi:hypothetical protein
MSRIREAGFSYMEVLIAAALIAMALVPMLDALQPGLQGAQIHADRAAIHFTVRGKLEEVIAQGFADLDAEALAAGSPTTPTAYSDTAADVPHEVFIARWDADNADADDDGLTGGDEGLLWVRVATSDGAVALHTLVTNR